MNTDQTAKIPIGTPIKFTLSGVVYYAQVTALTSSLMTIRGAPLTTSASALTAISYGDATRIAQVTISFPGYYEAATTSTAINTNLLIPSGLLWDMTTAYCVGLDIQNSTADSGATQAIINAIINGNALDTSNSSSGLSISGTSLVRSVVDISTSYYTIAQGQYIEVKITKGTNGDGTNLAVTLVFVIP
jgi:hypothetical protein